MCDITPIICPKPIKLELGTEFERHVLFLAKTFEIYNDMISRECCANEYIDQAKRKCVSIEKYRGLK